ncbi:MAG: hypothetical protein ACI8PB_005130 [Desulforhopalus sp.]|jgi:hypothetical protein
MKFKEIKGTIQAVGPIVWNSIKRGQLFNPVCELTEPNPDILCVLRSLHIITR